MSRCPRCGAAPAASLASDDEEAIGFGYLASVQAEAAAAEAAAREAAARVAEEADEYGLAPVEAPREPGLGSAPVATAVDDPGPVDGYGLAPAHPPPRSQPAVAGTPEPTTDAIELADSAPGAYGVSPSRTAGSTFQPSARLTRAPRSRPEGTADPEPDRAGPVTPPTQPETALGVSLLYPVWEWGGVALLAILPAVFLVTSLFSFGLRPYLIGDGEVTRMGALTLAFPMACLLALTGGYLLEYLAGVLECASHGEQVHPKWPGWEFFEILGSLLRWVWAVAPGFVLSGLVARRAWNAWPEPGLAAEVVCGAILGAGAAYAPVPLAAMILNADLRAASPLAILAALRRSPVACLRISLLFGGAGALFLAAAPLLYHLPGVLVGIAGTWLYWAAVCWAAMVLMRRLGLFYFHNRRRFDWFGESTSI